jgi:hypothetical protein
MLKETIQFTLGKQPLIKEKIIILEEADGGKAVIFPMYREKADYAHAEVAAIGEVLELTGKWGTDKKTNAPQFFVDSVFNAKIAKEEMQSNPPVNVNNGKPHEMKPPSFHPTQMPDKLSMKATLQENMKKNFYPGPLFDGDPYEINPEVDFIESDTIKVVTAPESKVKIYTDSRLWWMEKHETMRNKMILTPKLRELYLAQHDISALYSTSILTDEEEIEKRPVPGPDSF